MSRSLCSDYGRGGAITHAAPVQLHFFDRANSLEPGRAPEHSARRSEPGRCVAARAISRGTLAAMIAIAVFHAGMFAIGKALCL